MTPFLVVQHDDDCPPALLGTWLGEAGVTLDVRRPYRGEALPAPADLPAWSALLVLGGPMGALDDAEHPWLTDVKELVRVAARRSVPMLGVCLGHQLVAVALGGDVAPNPRGQQLGLVPVGWTDAADGDALVSSLATPRRGVHWNDDVVTRLPEDATVLAVAPGGEPQVVRYAPSVWGVQLHPEADASVVSRWALGDNERHRAAGVDRDELLADIDGARAELDAAWQPLAGVFADLAAEGLSS